MLVNPRLVSTELWLRLLPMNLNLVEARSPLRATVVSGERTRRRHQRFRGPMRFKRKGGFHEPGRDAFHCVRNFRRKNRTRWNASLPSGS